MPEQMVWHRLCLFFRMDAVKVQVLPDGEGGPTIGAVWVARLECHVSMWVEVAIHTIAKLLNLRDFLGAQNTVLVFIQAALDSDPTT